jgi:hypothetical protein
MTLLRTPRRLFPIGMASRAAYPGLPPIVWRPQAASGATAVTIGTVCLMFRQAHLPRTHLIVAA